MVQAHARACRGRLQGQQLLRTQRIKQVALLAPHPQVVVARHEEDVRKFLDHELEGGAQHSLVVRDVASQNKHIVLVGVV
jgi:hypothetical protein